MHGIEEFVRLAPAVWPGPPLDVQPGDLDRFVPMGNGLGNPMVMMPWDDLASVASRGAYYGLHPHTGHPFTGAPVTEAGGGTVYFDDGCERADVEALLRLMEVHTRQTDYAAFVREATANDQRYLTQLRIVGGGALKYLFDADGGPEGQALREQPLPIGELVWKFIEHFRQAVHDDRYSIDGALGGDGDWARESLAFGFMVENEYHAVYRLWTRAWLITK